MDQQTPLQLHNLSELLKFQDKQKEAWETLFNPQCKYLLYGGAAGGGKSYFLRWAAIGLGLYYFTKYKINNIPIGLFSEDYPTLKDRQILKIKNEFPNWLGDLKEYRDEGFAFVAKPEYGSFIIMLRNLDDPSKYASTEFAAELVEEITKNQFETFESLRFRLRYPGIEDVKFIGSTNPGEIGHAWVKKLWINPDPKYPDLEQERFFFIPATAYDNKYIEKGYITQLQSLSANKRKAWLEGSWDVFEGQVFGEWERRTHVVEPFKIPKEWKRYMAMDWGSNKPFSVGWYAQNYDGRTYLYRELYMNGNEFEKRYGFPLTPYRLSRMILAINMRAEEDYEYFVADPSIWNKIVLGEHTKKQEGESIAEMMMKAGITRMIKGDNDRINGMGRYRQALARGSDGFPMYQMFSTCYDSIRTVPALIYDKVRVEDVDTDGEDHCYDRDRYFFMSRAAPPIFQGGPQPTPTQVYFARMKAEYEKNQEDPEGLSDWGGPEYAEWEEQTSEW